MKTLLTILSCCFFALTSTGQHAASALPVADESKPMQVLDVSCGKCKFGMPGKSCDMAVRVDGKAYYADGVDIDQFGDAHAHDGMCNAIHKAEVQGEIVDNRFKVSYIKLLPAEKNNKKKNKN